jgi:hypothetical protein
MAWRIVKQPDGLYSRFSEVVDDFTHRDMTKLEAYELCRQEMGVCDAQLKMSYADANPARWEEALGIIERKRSYD